jgi:beta-1,4-mannosyltransferase
VTSPGLPHPSDVPDADPATPSLPPAGGAATPGDRRWQQLAAEVVQLRRRLRELEARPAGPSVGGPSTVRRAVGRLRRRALGRFRSSQPDARAATPPPVADPTPPTRPPGAQDLPEQELAVLLERVERDGQGRSVALCAPSADPGDRTPAAALARRVGAALRSSGWRVSLYPPPEWDLVPAADLVLAFAPGVDARRLPGTARAVAVVCDQPAAWTAADGAPLYDAWLATSRPIASVLRRRGAEPVTVLGDPSTEDTDSPAEMDVARAVDALTATPPRQRVWLGYFPDWRATNPYLEMLYCRATAAGVAAVPVANPALVSPLAFTGDHVGPALLHLHWSDAVAQSAPDEATAWARARMLDQRLAQFQSAGGRVVWTVHNARPHDLRFPGAEDLVLATLAARADVVHVMCAATLDAVRPDYEIPSGKVLVHPHPSYLGWYPDAVSRSAARQRLGLPADVPVALAFGQVRPYKGLEALLDALDDPLVARTGLTAVVAGQPGNVAGVAELVQRCREHPRVLARFGTVPADELQVYFRAADVCVLPYVRILNSGTLMAALTFGTPVVAPDQGCLPGTVDGSFASLYDPDADGALARALADLGRLRTPQARAAARARAEQLEPGGSSSEFLDALLGQLGLGRAAVAQPGGRAVRG